MEPWHRRPCPGFSNAAAVAIVPSMAVHTELFERLADLTRQERPCALVTVVRAQGSVPNALGAKMLVGPDGALLAGTIGGGLIEHQALAAGAEAIASKRSTTVTAKLTPKEAGGIGMNCGGSVEVFIDVQSPAPRLLLCGAGHISVALASMSRGLGYRVTVVDARPEWTNRERYPDTQVALEVLMPDAYLRESGAPEHTFIVIATHAGDLEVMEAAAGTQARYVGVVASRRKAITLAGQLRQQSPDAYDALEPRLRAPIGLDLGGREPEAVALSILSEIQALQYDREAVPMAMAPARLRQVTTNKNDSTSEHDAVVRVVGGGTHKA